MSDHVGIRVAIVGMGNCAGCLVEGIHHYRQHPQAPGLLFPVLGGFQVGDIRIVCGFDVADGKVGSTIGKSIYVAPNNFAPLGVSGLEEDGEVFRGPTLDGNPPGLQAFVTESPVEPVDVVEVLRRESVDVVVNFLPTGSIEATEYYGQCALEAGAAFINCIPTVYAQRDDVAARFSAAGVPVLGDDIKSQVGATIVHRALLQMLRTRGAEVVRSSQINVGGNTDFANFVQRPDTKVVSKRKSVDSLLPPTALSHVGLHYDPTQGAFNRTQFIIESTVFAGSTVRMTLTLERDDKPNAAGSVVDLIRIAKHELDAGRGGVVADGCAYYVKSQPVQMSDSEALTVVQRRWGPQ